MLRRLFAPGELKFPLGLLHYIHAILDPCQLLRRASQVKKAEHRAFPCALFADGKDRALYQLKISGVGRGNDDKWLHAPWDYLQRARLAPSFIAAILVRLS